MEPGGGLGDPGDPGGSGGGSGEPGDPGGSGGVGDGESRGAGDMHSSSNGGPQFKPLKLEFPRFDGENPSAWIYKANQFYSFYQTPIGQRAFLASFHMDGDALVWFQDAEEAGVFTSWEAFTKALYTRFGTMVYDDLMEALHRLRQTASVIEYKAQFELLSNRIRGLSEKNKLSCFISGLKDEIRFQVKLLNPLTLNAAFGLAKIEEESIATIKRSLRSGYMDPNRNNNSNYQKNLNPRSGHVAGNFNKGSFDSKPRFPIQRLSPAQMKERRDKGLCYNCDEKWNLQHQYTGKRIYMMEETEWVSEGEEEPTDLEKNQHEEPVEPEISLHAISSLPKLSTMRLMGKIGSSNVVILVDTGSTHNFLDPSLVKKKNLMVTNSK